MDEFIVVLTTTGSEKEAAVIASALVDRYQAACVSVIPSVRSIYRWKDKTWNEAEVVLLIKTTSSRFESVRRTIKELHSYELPEVLSLNVGNGDEKTLEWIRDCVRRGEDPAAAKKPAGNPEK